MQSLPPRSAGDDGRATVGSGRRASRERRGGGATASRRDDVTPTDSLAGQPQAPLRRAVMTSDKLYWGGFPSGAPPPLLQLPVRNESGTGWAGEWARGSPRGGCDGGQPRGLTQRRDPPQLSAPRLRTRGLGGGLRGGRAARGSRGGGGESEETAEEALRRGDVGGSGRRRPHRAAGAERNPEQRRRSPRGVKRLRWVRPPPHPKRTAKHRDRQRLGGGRGAGGGAAVRGGVLEAHLPGCPATTPPPPQDRNRSGLGRPHGGGAPPTSWRPRPLFAGPGPASLWLLPLSH